MQASPVRIARRLPVGMIGATVGMLAVAYTIQLVAFRADPHTALSDLPRVFAHREIGPGSFPYVDRVLEYPAGAGLLLYLASLVDPTPLGVLTVTALGVGVVCVVTTVVLERRCGPRAWRWALAVPLVVFAFQNWDVFAVGAMLGGLLAYERRRDSLAGALFGVGAAVKLFPAVVVPPLVALRLARGDWRGARRLAGATVATVAVVNLPFVLLNERGWWWTFSFQGSREASWGSAWFWLYRIVDVPVDGPVGAHIANAVSLVCLLAGVTWLTWRAYSTRMDPLVASVAAVAMFLLADKVYSPTYDVWLVVFFVLLPLTRRWWLAFCAVDLLVAVTVYGSFHGLDSAAFVREVLPWLVLARTALLVALVARTGTLGSARGARGVARWSGNVTTIGEFLVAGAGEPDLRTGFNPEALVADQTWVNTLGGDRIVGASSTMSLEPPVALGESLIERGLISRGELQMALELQRKTGMRFGTTLVELGIISWQELLPVLAARLGVTFVDLDTVNVDAFVAQSIPEEVARRYQVLPIARHGDEMLVVMREPNDVFAIDDLRLLLRADVVPVLGAPDQVRTAIERVWGGANLGTTSGEDEGKAEDSAKVSDLLAVAEGAPIVQMLNTIIARAVAERASDIHLEPTRDRLRVRYRIDGVLKDASLAPLAMHRATISRLKIMAGMDIAKTRLPQDGRFSAALNERSVDVRVATLPTESGEAAILRLLDKSEGLMELETLGFGTAGLNRYRAAYSVPQGAVITSGPTGSGKTSTLYAALLEINRPDRSIVAVEDPVEYRIDGIKQMQVATRGGLSFPTALRSILRSDPDVILVGEIRDAETARLAAEASLTGHLVFSSIHTTSAAAVPLRLIDMGVESFLVTSALTAVVGQRLLRRLCSECAEVYEPDRDTRAAFDIPEDVMELGAVRRPIGCSRCAQTGYLGRTGIYEVMTMSSGVNGLVKNGADRGDIEKAAVDEGMETLRAAALRHVGQGTVDLQELIRVGV